MKGPSKNPLTLGRWDPIGPILTKIENIQPGVLTYPFSKFKNPPFWTPIQCSNIDFYDIYLYIMHLYYDVQVTWYKQSYQKAIFNPENSQKVPKVAILAVSTLQSIIHAKLSIRMMIRTLSLNIRTLKRQNLLKLIKQEQKYAKSTKLCSFWRHFW